MYCAIIALISESMYDCNEQKRYAGSRIIKIDSLKTIIFRLAKSKSYLVGGMLNTTILGDSSNFSVGAENGGREKVSVIEIKLMLINSLKK